MEMKGFEKAHLYLYAAFLIGSSFDHITQSVIIRNKIPFLFMAFETGFSV